MKKFSLTFATAIIFALGTVTLRSMLTGSPASNPSGSSPAPGVSAATNSARSALPSHSPAAGKMGLIENYGKLPLSFEANQGQVRGPVKFLSHGRGYTIFLTADEAVLTLRKSQPPMSRFGKFGLPGRLEPFGPLDPRGGRWPSLASDWKSLWPSLIPDLTQMLHEPNAGKGGVAAGLESGPPQVLRMRLVGGNAKGRVVGLDELPGRSNYFIGNDPKKWRTNVPSYARVKYEGVYAGVDLVYYGNQGGQLEYDFVVAPGADPKQIKLSFAGAQGMRVDAANGDLVLKLGDDELRFHKPAASQPAVAAVYDRRRRSQSAATAELNGAFVLASNNEVAFRVAGYDPKRTLVIDPVLSYATYLGVFDWARGIAVDATGNAYVTGNTISHDFPTTPGAFQPGPSGINQAFVTKFNVAGSALVYSTYLGPGNVDDYGYGIAVDAAGNAYVAGYTGSPDFPTTPGAFQPSPGATPDAFVTKLNAAGSGLVYSTYLGGSGQDTAFGIAVDASGSAYVTGETYSSDFPTTPGAFQPIQPIKRSPAATSDAFVTKLNAAGSGLVYSTYLGGNYDDYASGIAVDAAGNAYVTGCTYGSSDFPTTPGAFQTNQTYYWDAPRAFVTKLNADGSALIYSTYLADYNGGDEFAYGIAVDASGSAYVTGETYSSDFPTTPGAFQPIRPGESDAFVTKLNAAGSALVYSTYLGGSPNLQSNPPYVWGGGDRGNGIAVDAAGNAYVTGYTTSRNFPTTPGASQIGLGGAEGDLDAAAFVTKVNAAGSALVYSTYLGSSSEDLGIGIAVDAAGNTYVTGHIELTVHTHSDFPTTPGAFQTSFGGAFVAKISPADVPGVSLFPASLTFDSQTVGLTSSPQRVTLRNVGSAPLTIDSIVASGDFAQTNTCGAGILGGSSCTIDVTFTPTATGTRPGLITITDNAADSPHIVSLTGIGIQPSISISFVSPGSLTLVQGGSSQNVSVNLIRDTYTGSVTLSTSTLPSGVTPNITQPGTGDSGSITLQAASDATLVSNQTITVTASGSGVSDITATFNLTVNPPALPTVTSLSPSSATAGGSAFTLTVNGTDFVNGSVVRWNGSDHTTTYLSSTQLTAAIPASDIASAGTVAVTVFNPAPGGGTSNSLNFTVNNPLPTLTSLSPSSATAGGAAFTLTVNGTDFVNGSVVRWGGVERATTYTSSTQLTASIPASDISTAGTAQVTVFNPTPGGGTSSSLSFTINNPAPTLTSLSPSSATAGGAAFTLTVNGTDFVDGSVVRCGGSDQTTTYVSSTQLTASITAADIATTGTVAVTVFNPTPGGGTSNSVNFTINNPAPTLTSLSPSSATAGGAAFTLTVNGTDFVNGSVVRWDGSDRTTTYVNSTQVTASIAGVDIATTGTVAVTVFNPTPGGGTSSSLSFAINNPAPSLTSLSPSSATAGGAALTLTVNGTDFINGSVVRWNGADRTTTHVSSTQLTASIPASDIASGGTAQVTVFNTAPGGGGSNAVTFNILDFSLSKNPSSATVTAGQTAEYTLTVSPLGGFNQSVSLSCSGAPSAATCSITPSSVTPDGTNNATATVRVTTTARAIAPPSVRWSPPGLRLRIPTLLLFMLLMLALLAVMARAGRERAWLRVTVALAALVVVSTLVACGGGGGGGYTPPPGTPAGTYTLTITATSGSLSHNTPVSLTVN